MRIQEKFDQFNCRRQKLSNQTQNFTPYRSGAGCMGMRPFYEMSYRGHENQFIGLYIEDPNCGETLDVAPAFVKCSGPGAIIPEDGTSPGYK